MFNFHLIMHFSQRFVLCISFCVWFYAFWQGFCFSVCYFWGDYTSVVAAASVDPFNRRYQCDQQKVGVGSIRWANTLALCDFVYKIDLDPSILGVAMKLLAEFSLELHELWSKAPPPQVVPPRIVASFSRAQWSVKNVVREQLEFYPPEPVNVFFSG